MKRSLFLLWICLATAGCLFQSCYDESNKYGNGLVSSAFRNISTDTSTVTVAAMLIDSLETSGKELILLGEYTHPVWGKMSASGYVSYNRPSYNTDIDERVVLDSLMLTFRYGGYYIGDTLKALRFNVHRLTQKLRLGDNGYLYNPSSFTYEAEPLASHSFIPRPNSGEEVEVRLPDEMGQDFLTRFHSRDVQVNSDYFEDYFKGLVVIPEGADNQSLLSFQVADSSAVLVLHYHIIDEKENEQELTFTPNTSTQFNHYEHDRSGTALEPFPPGQKEIPSSQLDNRGVLFGGLGWYARLEFPYINNILMQGEQVAIESALLKIYPEPGTFSAENALPDSLYLYIADENNVVTDAVTDYLGEEVQSGTLVKDDTYDENTYYYFDITSFMQQELGAFGMYKHNLQLVFNEDTYTKTFRNLTFSDQQGRSPIVLQLIYKVYESY